MMGVNLICDHRILYGADAAEFLSRIRELLEQPLLAGPLSDARQLDWEGCFNVRDLGGLPTADGRETRRGELVRADAVDRLTAARLGRAARHTASAP